MDENRNSSTTPIGQAGAWMAEGQRVALATVVETWGSSPCPAGSQMAISEKARFAGSVSGGCIETSVVSEAIEAIKDKKPVLLRYGVTDEQGHAAGLTCGGNIGVFVEPLDAMLLMQYQGRKPFVRAVGLDSGAWAVLRQDKTEGALSMNEAIRAGLRAAGQDGECCVIREGAEPVFIHPVRPAFRLIVIGAVRIAQSLAPMAVEAGFEVTIVDPRRAFATPERFPGLSLVCEWPDKALPVLNVDSSTAVVTLTHDAKPDDMALIYALRSPALYVGALGGRKSHAKRIARLKEMGLTDIEIARIRAPVGLDIGAETPAEIALSVIAEIVAAKNGKRFRP